MKKQENEGFIFLTRRVGRFALGQGTGWIPCKAQSSTEDIISQTDLFAGERTLARKLAEDDMSEEVLAWRRLMSVLLLWDAWEKDTEFSLQFHEFDGTSPLASAVLSTADASRQKEGLRVLCLHRGENTLPLAVGSKCTLVVPMAVPQGARLPRMMARLMESKDPCLKMNDAERSLVCSRLQCLLEENLQKPAKKSLRHFLEDLQQKDAEEKQRMMAENSPAMPDMLTRVKAVCGLYGEPCFEALTEETEALCTGEDTLFYQCFGIHDVQRQSKQIARKIYRWKGQRFARESDTLGLETTGEAEETTALAELAAEINTLEAHAHAWQKALGTAMHAWLKNRPDAYGHEARAAVQDAAIMASRDGQQAEEALHLEATAQTMARPAVQWLLQHALDALVTGADTIFTEGLMILPRDALGDEPLAGRYAVVNTLEEAALLPVSADCAEKLMRKDAKARWREDQSAVFRNGEDYRAVLTLEGQRTVKLEKHYDAENVLRLHPEEVPTVAVWPGVTLPEDQWKYEIAFAHLPNMGEDFELSVRLLADEAWLDGEKHTDGDNGTWWMGKAACFPSCFAVQVNGHDMGILPCKQEVAHISAGEEVTAAVDMGASGTSILLRQGDTFLDLRETPAMRIMMQGTGSILAAQMLPSAPMTPTVPTVEEIFGTGNEALLSGHMLRAGKPSADAAYGLKWGTSGTALGRAQRMYLKQMMLEACLTAALHGASGIRWRFAVPCGMAREGRKSWQLAVHEVAREAERDTGLKTVEIAFAEEHQAEHTYFREIVGIRGGMMTMDVGSSSTEIALWLHGMTQPAMNCSLPMGVQMMLLEETISHTELLRKELPEGQESMQNALNELAEQLSRGITSMKMAQQSQLALDAFMRDYGMSVMAAKSDENDGPGYLRAILLMQGAFLMTLVGLMQEQARQDSTLNDRLPPYMELCLAGRGATFLQGVDEMTRYKLTMFIRLCMSSDHPTREYPLIFSRNPKQEITLGMLKMTRLSPDVPDVPEIRDSSVRAEMTVALVLERFLLQMAAAFPAELSAIFGQTVENGHVTEQTKRAIDAASADGEKLEASMPVQCAVAFTALKQHLRQ